MLTLTDSIATLGETTGYYALNYMRGKMLANDEGHQILRSVGSLSVTLRRPFDGSVLVLHKHSHNQLFIFIHLYMLLYIVRERSSNKQV